MRNEKYKKMEIGELAKLELGIHQERYSLSLRQTALELRSFEVAREIFQRQLDEVANKLGVAEMKGYKLSAVIEKDKRGVHLRRRLVVKARKFNGKRDIQFRICGHIEDEDLLLEIIREKMKENL